MLTSHHSFSTRIFLKETPGVHASALTSAATSEQPENLREFWWFLRGDRKTVEGRSPDRPRSGGSRTLNGKKHA